MSSSFEEDIVSETKKRRIMEPATPAVLPSAAAAAAVLPSAAAAPAVLPSAAPAVLPSAAAPAVLSSAAPAAWQQALCQIMVQSLPGQFEHALVCAICRVRQLLTKMNVEHTHLRSAIRMYLGIEEDQYFQRKYRLYGLFNRLYWGSLLPGDDHKLLVNSPSKDSFGVWFVPVLEGFMKLDVGKLAGNYAEIMTKNSGTAVDLGSVPAPLLPEDNLQCLVRSVDRLSWLRKMSLPWFHTQVLPRLLHSILFMRRAMAEKESLVGWTVCCPARALFAHMLTMDNLQHMDTCCGGCKVLTDPQ